jgi:hypothetical protein
MFRVILLSFNRLKKNTTCDKTKQFCTYGTTEISAPNIVAHEFSDKMNVRTKYRPTNFIEEILLCYELKTICYSSIKHNQVLFKYDNMFQSKKTSIRPTLQKF